MRVWCRVLEHCQGLWNRTANIREKQEKSWVQHICSYILWILFQDVSFTPHAEIFHEMPLLCSRLHWVGGCSHYVFDTRAITLFSHPQMNTAKLQTPAVTLLQISHNSVNISQAVKITRLPRSPPLLFRASILPAVTRITHVRQIWL